MNRLTVLARPEAATDGLLPVYWANGIQRQGCVRVAGAQSNARPTLVAELAALHHLLVTVATYGPDQAGNGLSLCVSSGQIKKLARNTSNFVDYYCLSRFLRTRFADAPIDVSGSGDWIKPRADQYVSEIEIAASLDAMATVPLLGSVIVSEHAVEMFSQRSTCKANHKAWSMLCNSLAHATRFVLPSAAQVRDMPESDDRGSVLLYDQLYGWLFVITPPSESRCLPVVATVYPPMSSSLRHEPLSLHATELAALRGASTEVAA